MTGGSECIKSQTTHLLAIDIESRYGELWLQHIHVSRTVRFWMTIWYKTLHSRKDSFIDKGSIFGGSEHEEF